MREALAGVPRAPKRKPGQGYEDSNLSLRGKVLSRLREAERDGDLGLREIADSLRRDGTDVEVSRLWAAVKSLEDDGLARTTLWGDPRSPSPAWEPAGAVAEGRAAYDAGTEAGTLAGIRVALP